MKIHSIHDSICDRIHGMYVCMYAMYVCVCDMYVCVCIKAKLVANWSLTYLYKVHQVVLMAIQRSCQNASIAKMEVLLSDKDTTFNCKIFVENTHFQ